MSLTGKTLFISGASRGIGLAIAKRAARDGASIAIAAKTAEPNPKLPGTIYTAAEEIERAGGKALPLICDIRDADQIEAAVEKTAAHFGGIDICINNASAISLTSTLDTDSKRYDLMHQINSRGTYLVSRACIPHLKKAENAHVLTLAPPLDLVPEWFAPYPAYAMSKYAMSIYSMAMAKEFIDEGIAFNTLWPKTLIATAAVKNIVAGEEGIARSRTPEIMADAAYIILTKPSREFTGHHLIDEAVLANAGISDLRGYRTVPGEGELELDLFVKEELPLPEGLLV
ncbi:SDR family oxidoreductase [Microbulbifer pacificus]|uniref:NAD(P)-dependent oxidoreductase n=1 Tax=Microbulbifer pacificus TaxID=407164 RepID=A0AAU0N3Z8_9GAMM|nr:NAD(P)-dependent oxidoreductase [Microbulbifer pacificus]WOX07009.1 NAD(P)-dependent oxidoreductase [Microbulbifer pacificus]